jgi:hypothetical protein
MKKWKTLLELCAGLPIVAAFGYGFIIYPNAPLEACTAPTGYCDKMGGPHAVAEYRAFLRWERTTIFVILPAGAFALFLIRRPSKPLK